MQEAWSFLGGAVMGFAFAVFFGWCLSYRGKAVTEKAEKKAAAVARANPVTGMETVTSQDFTLTHTDKRVYVTFSTPDGYSYKDTKGGALIATLPGINCQRDEAAA